MFPKRIGQIITKVTPTYSSAQKPHGEMLRAVRIVKKTAYIIILLAR